MQLPFHLCHRRLFSTFLMLKLVSLSLFFTDVVWAQSAPEVLSVGVSQSAVDTVWIVTAGALVFFMQAGFALLEAGMSRSKNAVNVIMKNYTDACMGSLIFWMVGYGLMFGTNSTGVFGQDNFMPDTMAATDYTFLFFQMMFAATAVTIASGAMAERTNYFAYLIGAVCITGFIYPIYGSWVWGSNYEGQGWLSQLGFIDFAGSTVVHSIGAWVALAGIMILGPRLGRFSKTGTPHEIPGHNLTFMSLGGFILWFGWFGFNGGSTVAASEDIGLIVLNTQLSAAAAVTSLVMINGILKQPIYASQVVNACLGGLVAITAGCATMTPGYAVITGFIAGFVLKAGMNLLERLRIDDVVGAVSVHGFCGIWGTLAAGLFLTGNLFDPKQILVQSAGILAAVLWALPLSFVMYWIIDKTVGLRVSSNDERRGLDYTEHYELAYPEFQDNLLPNEHVKHRR